jgi:hypothetical protein
MSDIVRTVSSSPDNAGSDNDDSVSTADKVDGDDSIELPTQNEISKKLCLIDICSNTGHSMLCREESLVALDKLGKWAYSEDPTFFEYFDTFGGVARVLYFLRTVVDNETCNGVIRMKFIRKAVRLTARVCFLGVDETIMDIVKKNATNVVNFGGIETLLLAGNECKADWSNSGSTLKIISLIWYTLSSITCLVGDMIVHDRAYCIFICCVDIIGHLRSVTDPMASEILCDVLGTLNNIMSVDHIDLTREFKGKAILSKCLEILKKDGALFSYGNDVIMATVVDFLDTCYHKELLNQDLDQETFIYLCVIGLKQFPANGTIRKQVVKLLDGACSTIYDKKIIERADTMVGLAPLLTSDDIDEVEKDNVRGLMRKILAL